MNQELVDNLLVDWELARQQGREIGAAELCKDHPHLKQLVAESINVLRRTMWMLDDPAPEPFDAIVLQTISSMILEASQRQETKVSSDVETSKSNAVISADADRAKAEPAPSLLIEGFQLKEELGRGGFGIVYRALDEKLDRYVAIKVPILDNPVQREKYIREARHAAKVEVPGIVPVLQVGTTENGLPFVVQKLIDGKSLAEILHLGGKLSPSQAIGLLVDVCKAVGSAHAHALVHRDLKPGNILVDQFGKPWVTDFGLAITEDDQAGKKGEVAGTPSYMAPEQLQGKVDWFDGRTDIWALGVIMYEALTGKMPFRAPTRGELREQILKREPRPICQRMPLLPKQWDAILRRCCAKSIKERYDSAFDLANDLLELGNFIGEESQQSLNPLLYELQRSKDPITVHDATRSSSRSDSANQFERQSATVPAQPTRSWSLLGNVALILVAILAIAGLLWNKLGGPDALSSGPASSSDVASSAPATMDSAPQNGGIEIADPVLARPRLVVAVSEEPSNDDRIRLFSTIQAAIDVADETEEILVRPGEYNESLFIRKPVVLRGEKKGAADTSGQIAAGEGSIRLLGTQDATIVVSRGASLSLVGIDVLPVRADAKTNTIEVEGGQLDLADCRVTAALYDCVKLAPDSRFQADNCHFVAFYEPAIAAKRTQEFALRKCTFDLSLATGKPPTPSPEFNLAGVQAIEMAGRVSECAFQGSGWDSNSASIPGPKGIEWLETEDDVQFVDCTFRDLVQGIHATRCARLQIEGTLGSAQFANCGKAIELTGCNGSLRNCQIEFAGDGGRGTAGIQIDGRARLAGESSGPNVTIASVRTSGLDSALVIRQASVTASDLEILNSKSVGISIVNNADFQLTGPSTIRNSLDIGVQIESSSAILQRCRIAECSTAGIVVDGLNDALTASGCTMNLNGVGVILLSGSARLTNPQIYDTETGVLVAHRSELFRAPKNDAPLELLITGGRIAARLRSIQFLSPATYQLDGCALDDPHATPGLAAGLSAEQLGDVVVIKPNGR